MHLLARFHNFSDVNIVAAVEFVSGVLVLVHLNLNAVMVKVVLLAEHPVSICKNGLLLAFAVSVKRHMAGERVLVVV